MRRLRAWWGPKEPVERAGIAAGVLLVIGIIVFAMLPAEFRESLAAAFDNVRR